MKLLVKKVLLVSVFAVFVLPLFGCETVQGVGRDVSKAGEAIENAAKK